MVNFKDLESFSIRVESLQEEILASEYKNPEAVKQSPLFTISDAAKYVGVSRKLFNDLIADESIERVTPIKTLEKEGVTIEKTMPAKFTLDQIEKIRQHLKANGQKGNYTNRRPKHTKKPYTLMIGNLKGGANKTTVSIHLAQWLALNGYRVLGIDSDPQGSFTSLMGFLPYEYKGLPDGAYYVDEINTLYPLYSDNEPLRPVKTYWQNLDIIPANIDVYSAEFSLPARQIRDGESFFDILAKALVTKEQDWPTEFDTHYNGEYLGDVYNPDDYDIIIIDTPPSYSYATLNAIQAADAMVIPVPAQHLDILATGIFFKQMVSVFSDLEQIFGFSKEFDFVVGLKTKMSENFEALQNGGRISAIFRESLINTPFLISKSITVASDFNKTAYELQNTDIIGRSTLKKSLDNLEQIHLEIENKIKQFWQIQTKLEIK
ncbi:AAA family ATPase [Thiomicrospira microaerophila]|uniref:AAA family ATPase n=1 Tax=Thiomicrospira microaerophila TaxID=406020 RepID=UPI0005C9CF25|nr:AAA family ATPase [Thiomicrospira microaerophila]